MLLLLLFPLLVFTFLIFEGQRLHFEPGFLSSFLSYIQHNTISSTTPGSLVVCSLVNGGNLVQFSFSFDITKTASFLVDKACFSACIPLANCILPDKQMALYYVSVENSKDKKVKNAL